MKPYCMDSGFYVSKRKGVFKEEKGLKRIYFK
jgi:hypothetical protein